MHFLRGRGRQRERAAPSKAKEMQPKKCEAEELHA